MKRKDSRVDSMGSQERVEHDLKLRAEEELRRAEEASAKEEQSLVDDLNSAGVRVNSVWDLVNTKASYPAAIPVLVRHLKRGYSSGIRAGIARALGVPGAKAHWDELVALYRVEENEFAKQGFAVAVSGSAPKERVTDLVEMLRDRSLGYTRALLLGITAKHLGQDAAVRLLVELSSDHDLAVEISRMLYRKPKRGTRPSR